METKGKKNTPITARVSTGLFNKKKGVQEPLLDVGPAGVSGNNQTRDISSPSKMKGYSMKASPFKQVGVNVLTKEQTGSTSEKGDEIKKTVKYTDLPEDIRKQAKADNLKKFGTLNPTAAGLADNTVGTGTYKPDKEIPGKITESNEFTANKTRDKGDAQTALDRRNVIRAGKVAARTEKAAQRKIDRLDRKEGKNTKTKKKQRLERKRTQAESNREVSQNVVKGVKNQSDQNIGPRSNKDVLSTERNMSLSDVGGKTAQDEVIKAGEVKKPQGPPKKTTDFFKKKTPLKMKYFK